MNDTGTPSTAQPVFKPNDALLLVESLIEAQNQTMTVATYTLSTDPDTAGKFGPVVEAWATVDESTFTDIVIDVRLDDGNSDFDALPVVGRYRLTIEPVEVPA